MKEDVEHVPSVTVASFLETGGDGLSMEVVAGKRGLERHIKEATLNRPGLALSGFFRYFAHRRIQVLGLSELAYLDSLSPEERAGSLRGFFEKKIPCVVITRNRKLMPEVRDLAEELRIPVLRTPMVTKHFINTATIIMANLSAPRMTVLGTMVEILGIGVLIEGKAGVGKSETALSLISKGYALISDDVTALRRDSSGALIGSPVRVTRYHMEIRGLGIIHVPSLFGVASVRAMKRLDLVVRLFQPAKDKQHDRDLEEGGKSVFLGVTVPRIRVPVGPGRDIANVVEAAALNYKLRGLGHDAEKELDERLVALLSGGSDASE